MPWSQIGGSGGGGILADDATNSSVKILDFDTDVAPLLGDNAWRSVDIFAIFVDYTATGGAGTRLLVAEVLDSDDNILCRFASAVTITASQQKTFTFGRGLPAAAAIVTISSVPHAHDPLPDGLFLGPGMKLKVYDAAAIAATGDDVVVNVLYR